MFHLGVSIAHLCQEGWPEQMDVANVRSHTKKREEHMISLYQVSHNLHWGEPMMDLLPLANGNLQSLGKAWKHPCHYDRLICLLICFFSFQLQLNLTFRAAYSVFFLTNSSDSSISWQTGVTLSNCGLGLQSSGNGLFWICWLMLLLFGLFSVSPIFIKGFHFRKKSKLW